jgi:hypothetical protein
MVRLGHHRDLVLDLFIEAKFGPPSGASMGI